MISFGLSKTYTQVIISRSIAGFLNGNAGVAKTMIAEMSDDTNRAILFTFLPVAWISGCTVAPFVGGSLQHPAERFPAYFDHPLWRRYPYFLPCFVAASFPIFAFFIGLMFLKETNESVRRVPRGASYGSVSSEDRFESTPRNSSTPTLREAITKPVVIAIANYAALAIIDISLFAIFTVFLAVPLHAGGLNLPPQVIGNILASLGGVSGATQFLAFPRVHKRFGGKKTFTFSISFSFLLLACFPIIHVITLVYPGSWIKFAIIGVMMVIWSVYDMGYASVFLFITASSPSPSLLGTVNGAAQTIISLARAFGPAAATSLFALSIKHDWLRGYGVFLCLTLAPVVAICLSTLLPNDVEAKISRDESA
ncbi:major facilitator superfamily domain-containing protein [Cantharellus anzutake]|uniref:major facilitator superfamily domain-containing protein n=1 Tax=Cantharellus anzutake TaxID=1750568 RepID=UPI00190653AF|nr:major facilitator superfamily domain-containing protein [Cantharellus anzutake]KAF8325449.1 major facilitator superfamily domain-containing protein [Cantharellus anzutake]